ncbi:MAG: response regulator [Pseudomonadota bacterium]
MPRNLLVVDDESSVISSLRRVMRGENYKILSAASGAEALAILAEQPVSLILCDLGMPGMTGFELLEIVKKRYPTVVRTILSDQTRVGTLLWAINEGEVYRFFTKPWDNDEMRDSLRRVVCHADLVAEADRLATWLEERKDILRQLLDGPDEETPVAY